MKCIPVSLIGTLEIVSKAKNRRIICGYGNIAVVDSENQLIPLETLKSGLITLLTDMSYANLMLSHNNIQVGKILRNYGKLETHVDDKGLFVVAELRTDIETANETWEKILKGEINGFSIGCEVLSEPREVCDANGCVTYLDKINILEISICKFPVNQMSGFTVISKSDSIGKNVCQSCQIKVDNMSEDKKEEQKVEVKEETKELSTEERLEAMERSIFNIQAAIEKLSAVTKEEEKKPEEIPLEEKKPTEAPCKSETVATVDVAVTTLTKKDFDEFKNEIAKLLTALTESLKPDVKLKSELELAVKARDEQIENMKKELDKVTTKEQIKTIEKAEEDSEPKTVQDIVKCDEQLEGTCPIEISNGEVTFKKFV